MNQRFVLYSKGLSDRQIAERVNVHYSTIWAWRKAEGLPPNRTVNKCYNYVHKRPEHERRLIKEFMINLLESSKGDRPTLLDLKLR